MSIMSRRTFLRSAAAAAVAPVATRVLPAAGRQILSCGCCLRTRDVPAVALSGSGMVAATPDATAFAYSSGDPTTDQFLGRALLRLATTFKVRPGFAFFDDQRSPNAFATPETLLPDTSGTVIMGKRLFSENMGHDDDGMTIIAICAHEYGHIHQFQSGYHDDLQRLDTTVKPVELHADFLAGSFLALRKKEHADLNLLSVGQTFYQLGDTNFNQPQHHGTARERIAAITAGFDLARGGVQDIDQVAKAGIDFVRRFV
jgi:hypothetical protein